MYLNGIVKTTIIHEHLFDDIGCNDNSTGFIPCDIDSSKTILTEINATDWDIKRYKSDKLRYYNLYKYDNSPADYTFMNISKYQNHCLLNLDVEFYL